MSSFGRRLFEFFHPEGIPWPGSLLYNRVSRSSIFQHHYELVAGDIAVYCPSTGGQLLDVGTGPGWLLLKVHELCPAMRLVGTDISAAMVARAKANITTAGLTNRIQVVKGAANHPPFPDCHFEVVTSTGSMHHWKDQVGSLNDIYRVLKPGGHALIYDLVLDTPADAIERMTRLFGRWRMTLFKLHSLEEPFGKVADLEAVARGTRFGQVQAQFIGLLCCLRLRR